MDQLVKQRTNNDAKNCPWHCVELYLWEVSVQKLYLSCKNLASTTKTVFIEKKYWQARAHLSMWRADFNDTYCVHMFQLQPWKKVQDPYSMVAVVLFYSGVGRIRGIFALRWAHGRLGGPLNVLIKRQRSTGFGLPHCGVLLLPPLYPLPNVLQKCLNSLFHTQWQSFYDLYSLTKCIFVLEYTLPYPCQ